MRRKINGMLNSIEFKFDEALFYRILEVEDGGIH